MLRSTHLLLPAMTAPPCLPAPARRAKYGFEAGPRPGCCRICGQEGHWARDCEK